MADEGVVKLHRHRISMALLGEFLLFDEGVGIEPFQQRSSIGRHHLALHIMQMQIDETGQDQVGAMIDDLGPGKIGRGEIAHGNHLAVLDADRAVREIEIALGIVEVLRRAVKTQHPTAQNGPAHEFAPSRYHSTSSARSASVISVRLPGGMAWLQPAWMTIS